MKQPCVQSLSRVGSVTPWTLAHPGLLCWSSHPYTCIPSFMDFLPIHVTTVHWGEFPVLYDRFSLVVSFIHSINSVYVLSQSPNPSHFLFLLISKYLFSESVFLFFALQIRFAVHIKVSDSHSFFWIVWVKTYIFPCFRNTYCLIHSFHWFAMPAVTRLTSMYSYFYF